MGVFISYSRDNEAVAHLLHHILTTHGVSCDIDRKLPAGEKFDIELMKKIEDAEAVLLLLTKSSADSAWVNQEIGFATAKGKMIYPVALESGVVPQGMIATAQSHAQLDWSDTAHSIDRLIETLRRPSTSGGGFYQAVGLDQVIHGKLHRTQFLIDQFHELRKHKPSNRVVLHQAAFSIFAVGKNTIDPNSAYERMLLEEREGLAQLIESGVRLDLIVWPVNVRRVKERFENLITWMESMLNNDRVRFACADHGGENLYIVEERFCAAGVRLHGKSGFEMTLVKHQPKAVAEAGQEFKNKFAYVFTDKVRALEQVRLAYGDLCGSNSAA